MYVLVFVIFIRNFVLNKIWFPNIERIQTTNTNYLGEVFCFHVPPAIGFILGHVSTNFTPKLGSVFVWNDKRTPTSLKRPCNMKLF